MRPLRKARVKKRSAKALSCFVKKFSSPSRARLGAVVRDTDERLHSATVFGRGKAE
jgi:hypothetical protein